MGGASSAEKGAAAVAGLANHHLRWAHAKAAAHASRVKAARAKHHKKEKKFDMSVFNKAFPHAARRRSHHSKVKAKAKKAKKAKKAVKNPMEVALKKAKKKALMKKGKA